MPIPPLAASPLWKRVALDLASQSVSRSFPLVGAQLATSGPHAPIVAQER